MARRTWEEYALRLAEVAAEQSEDPYCKVGACGLRVNHTIANVGFNGTKPGITIDWSDREGRRKKVVHAEINCLAGTQLGEIEMMVSTLIPCTSCLTTAARWGVKRIYYRDGYGEDQKHYGSVEETQALAKELDIELKQINEKTK